MHSLSSVASFLSASIFLEVPEDPLRDIPCDVSFIRREREIDRVAQFAGIYLADRIPR